LEPSQFVMPMTIKRFYNHKMLGSAGKSSSRLKSFLRSSRFCFHLY
jgi:hypothetical protein